MAAVISILFLAICVAVVGFIIIDDIRAIRRVKRRTANWTVDNFMGGAQQLMGPGPGAPLISMSNEQFMAFASGQFITNPTIYLDGGVAQNQFWEQQAKAVLTAEVLLVRHLTDEQRASWEKHKGFWATAKSGNRYWLDGQRPRGLPLDGPPQSYCIHGTDEEGRQLPAGDTILAQKLLIETDEEKFLKTANASRL